MTTKRMARRTPSGRTASPIADDETVGIDSPIVPLPEPEQNPVESPVPITSVSPGERRTKLGARKSVKHAANVVEDAPASPSGVASPGGHRDKTIAEVIIEKQKQAAAERRKSKKLSLSKTPVLPKPTEPTVQAKPTEDAIPTKPIQSIYERRTKRKHSENANTDKQAAVDEPAKRRSSPRKEKVKRAPAAPAEPKMKVKRAPAAPAEASEPAEPVKASSSKPVKPAEDSKKRKTRASESVNVSSPSKQSEQPLKKQKGDKQKAGKEKVEEKVDKQKAGKEKVEKETGRKGKKVVDEKPVQSSKVPSVRIRTTPKALYNVLNCLKDNQKEVVRQMGFGSLLSMRLDEISGTLGYYVVKNFDVFDLELKLPTGRIKVTPQVVHDILGIPMGDIELMSLPLKDLKGDDVYSIGCWRSQFGKSIRPSHLSDLILNSDDSGLVFKLNFLMLFASTMVCCDGSGGCSASCQSAIVSRISDQTEVHKINWCGFLIDQLKICKNFWNPADKTYYFTGPMTFLQLLYLDSTLFENFPIARERPAIKYWNSTYLNKRVALELKSNRKFGKLPLQPAFSEDVVEEGFVASTSGQQADQTSSQTSTEEYLMQLDTLLKKGVSLFPGDLKLSELNDKFQQLFREGKSSTQPDDDDGGDDGDQNDGDDPNDDDGRDDGEPKGNDDDKDDDDGKDDDGKDDDVAVDKAELDESRETDTKSDPKDDENDNTVDPCISATNPIQLTVPDPCIPATVQDVGVSTSDTDYIDQSFLIDDDWFIDPAFEEVFKEIDDSLNKRQAPSFPTYENLTPPSFSLLSQDYSSPPNCVPFVAADTVSPKAVSVSPQCVVSRDTAETVKIDEPDTLKQHRNLKRLVKPSKFYKSPYMDAQTQIPTAVSGLEWMVAGSVFQMKGDPFEIVFETNSGQRTPRLEMESLAPSVLVYANVIDSWAVILNEEQVKADGCIFRLFLDTSMISNDMWNGKLTFEKAFEIFEINMLACYGEKLDVLSMKDVSLVFFPVIAHDHFYLIVFNLKRVGFHVIDNSAACEDYIVKYKQVGSIVHSLFSKHLELYSHPKAAAISKVKPSVMKMKWKTVNNHVDCGVFVMCHMDTYMGEAASKWNPGFLPETATGKVTQQLQITKLRLKYATKMLLHELNIHKEKMVAYANEFSQYDFFVGKKMINEAIKNRHLRDIR